MTEMFEASTLGSMPAKIEAGTLVASINWKTETAPEEGLRHLSPANIKSLSTGTGLTVLLSGSTGL
jgi:hypothetical protein